MSNETTDPIKASKVLVLNEELHEAKQGKKRAQSLVRAQNEEIKRIQAEIDDILEGTEAGELDELAIEVSEAE